MSYRAIPFLVLAIPSTAVAQHHHGAGDAGAAEPTLRLQMSAVAARLDAGSGPGGYGGVLLGGRYQRGRLTFGAVTALWNVWQDGRTRMGSGDSAVDVEVTAVERTGEHVQLAGGVAAMLMLPTAGGSGLGMGHSMAMGGSWLTVAGHDWSAIGALSYAIALEDSAFEHAHHGDDLIDPSNASELALNARLSRRITGPWHGHLGGRAAAPIAIDHGVWRGVAGAGVRRSGRRWDVGARAEVAIGGEPWTVRSMLDVARSF